MATAALVLVCLAASQGRAVDPVRVEVLSLLVPQRVAVTSPEAALELPLGGRLVPGARLEVERDGDRVVARSGAWRWRGARLVLGAPGEMISVDVRGRDRRVRTLEGRLAIDSDGRALRLVVETDLERLVASAVAAELDHVTEPAALEAAAVAIRSYLIANRGRHAAEGFDFCDTTHCVFSRGAPDPTGAPERAAAAAALATRGLVLERDGHVVAGYLTACCGGRTTTPADLWNVADDGDYEPVACTSCSRSEFYRWRRAASVDAVAGVISRLSGTRVGPDADLRAVAGDGGWTRWVVATSGGREARVAGDAFRMAVGRALGWDTLPSPRFVVERDRGRFRFEGGGFGHGIGLCVAGTVERARRGAARDQILATYFPRARVVLLEGGR